MKIELPPKKRWVFVLTAIVAIALSVFYVPKFLNLVEFLGYRIPQPDVRLDYLKGVLWAILLGSTIIFWPIRSSDKKALLLVWLVKCLVMLGFMLFYEYYYQSDAFNHFSASKHVGNWTEKMSSPIAIIAVLVDMNNQFFFDSFHAAKVSFGMLGLISVYIFYRAAVVFLRQEKLKLLYFIAFFPTILFWSSILGKEPIVFLGMAIYCFGAINWFKNKNLLFIFVLLCGVILVAHLRIWMGVIMVLPVLISSFFITETKVYIKIMGIFILILAFLFYLFQLATNFNIRYVSGLLEQLNLKAFYFSMGGSGLKAMGGSGLKAMGGSGLKAMGGSGLKAMGGSGLKAMGGSGLKASVAGKANTFNNLWDFLFFTPKGLFTLLFRPLPGEVNNLFGILSGLEGFSLLVLFVFAIKKAHWQKLLSPIPIWIILLILTWGVAYSAVAFNLGTVCRYRLQILPIFLGLILYLLQSVDGYKSPASFEDKKVT